MLDSIQQHLHMKLQICLYSYFLPLQSETLLKKILHQGFDIADLLLWRPNHLHSNSYTVGSKTVLQHLKPEDML